MKKLFCLSLILCVYVLPSCKAKSSASKNQAPFSASFMGIVDVNGVTRAKVAIKNNSDKVISGLVIDYLCYDKDGNDIKYGPRGYAVTSPYSAPNPFSYLYSFDEIVFLPDSTNYIFVDLYWIPKETVKMTITPGWACFTDKTQWYRDIKGDKR